jgi:hypothetical protein
MAAVFVAQCLLLTLFCLMPTLVPSLESTDFPATANPRPFDELSEDLKAQQVFMPCLFMFLLFGLLLNAFCY